MTRRKAAAGLIHCQKCYKRQELIWYRHLWICRECLYGDKEIPLPKVEDFVYRTGPLGDDGSFPGEKRTRQTRKPKQK